MATTAETLGLGIQLHESGNFAEAERLYKQVLQEEPNHAEALHLLGVIAYQLGKSVEAIDYIKQAIASDGKNAQHYYNLGQVYCARAEYDLAISSYNKSIDLCATVPEIYIALGDAYDYKRKTAKGAYEQKTDIDKAISSYYRALAIKADLPEVQKKLKALYEIHPDLDKALVNALSISHSNFDLQLYLGDSLRKKGNLEDAISAYQRALSVKPDSVEAHDKLATTYLMRGRIGKAREACEIALEIEPEYAFSHVTLGNILQQEDKLEEAIASYQKALELNPNLAEAESNLGAAFHKQGDADNAILHYKQAIELKPELYAAYVNIAGLLYDQGKVEEGLDYWQQVVEIKPELANAQVYTDLGVRRTKQGNIEQAESFYRKAIELEPKAGLAYLNLAGILQSRGDLEGAIANYKKAIEARPDVDISYLALSQILRHQGQASEALEYEYKVLTLKPAAYGAEVHFNVGNALAQLGKVDEAAQCYQQALVLQPQYADAYTNLGLVLLHCGKVDEAIVCLQKAVEINPNSSHAQSGLEQAQAKQAETTEPQTDKGREIFYFRLATKLQEQNQLDEAIANYRKAIEAQPNFAEAYSNLGVVLLRQNQTEEAIANFERALAIKPEYINALCNLGIALSQQEKFAEAIANFNKALALNPKHIDSLYNLSSALAKQEKVDEAIAELKKVLDIQPQHVAALVSLGSLVNQQKKYDEATTYLQSALEISPYNAEVNCAMGAVLASRHEKLGEAIAYFNKAVEIRPNYALAYLNLGSALGQLERFQDAINCLGKVIELEPDSYEGYCKLGELTSRVGMFEPSLNYLDTAIAINPKRIDAYSLKIYVLGVQWRIDEAITCLNIALQIKPNAADLYYNYANALAAQGKLDKAIAQLEKAIEVNPEFIGAYCSLGGILSMQNKNDEAIACYRKALEVQPDSAEVLYRLGTALAIQEKFDEATSCLQKSLDIQPDYADAYWQLINLYSRFNAYDLHRKAASRYRQLSGKANIIPSSMALMNAYLVSGMNDLAKKTFLEDLEPEIYKNCDTLSPQNVGLLYASLLFTMPNVRDDIAKNSQISKLVGEQYIEKCVKPQYPNEDNLFFLEDATNRPLRIGILSPYFRRHSVGWCSGDVIKELANLTPHLFLYGTTAFNPDDRTQMFIESGAKFFQPGKIPTTGKIGGNLINQVSESLSSSSDDKKNVDPGKITRDLIDQIIQDELDILIELDSITSPVHAEVLHCKAAPVCVTWLGWDAPYTSSDNYFLCDWYTHPDGTEEFYREKLVRMPGSFMCVSNLNVHPVNRDEARAAMNIRPDQVIYLGIVPGRKFNPDVVKAQVEILKHVPESVFIHKGTGEMEQFQAGYRKECELQGVDFNRFIFQGTMSPEEAHRTSYLIADVILDPYPCNGGTISLEALYFNLPLVTITGQQFFARMGYSFLKTLGIEEGISFTWQEYVDWGVKFGLDHDLRNSIKNRLIQSKQPESLSLLWDTKRYAKDMYRIFEELLQENL